MGRHGEAGEAGDVIALQQMWRNLIVQLIAPEVTCTIGSVI